VAVPCGEEEPVSSVVYCWSSVGGGIMHPTVLLALPLMGRHCEWQYAFLGSLALVKRLPVEGFGLERREVLIVYSTLNESSRLWWIKKQLTVDRSTTSEDWTLPGGVTCQSTQKKRHSSS